MERAGKVTVTGKPITRAEAHKLFVARQPVAARIYTKTLRGTKGFPVAIAQLVVQVPTYTLSLAGDVITATGSYGERYEITLGPVRSAS